MFSTLKSVNSAQKRASIEATLPLIFDAIDTNGDGGIAVAEFTAYFQSLGINDAKVSSEVFNSMDLNGDGELSREGLIFIFFNSKDFKFI